VSQSAPPERARELTELAAASHASYRALVWDDPGFVPIFRAFTPVDELAMFEIGSRPARRPNSDKPNSDKPNSDKQGAGDYLPRLRAIPWVFGWTQTVVVPAGTAAGDARASRPKPDGPRSCAACTARSRFRSLVENLEMTLAKSSLEIARGYLELVPAELEPERRFAAIAAEHARTVEAVKAIVGAKALLDRHPVLQRSIRLRNPYVDPMNAIQVELLRRHRDPSATDEEREAVRLPLLRSIPVRRRLRTPAGPAPAAPDSVPFPGPSALTPDERSCEIVTFGRYRDDSRNTVLVCARPRLRLSSLKRLPPQAVAEASRPQEFRAPGAFFVVQRRG
jgi:phosphoenolpyruvate carboxylase